MKTSFQSKTYTEKKKKDFSFFWQHGVHLRNAYSQISYKMSLITYKQIVAI